MKLFNRVKKYSAWLTIQENINVAKLVVSYPNDEQEGHFIVKTIPLEAIGALRSKNLIVNNLQKFELLVVTAPDGDPDVIEKSGFEIDVGKFSSLKDLNHARKCIEKAIGKGRLTISRIEASLFAVTGGLAAVALYSLLLGIGSGSIFGGNTVSNQGALPSGSEVPIARALSDGPDQGMRELSTARNDPPAGSLSVSSPVVPDGSTPDTNLPGIVGGGNITQGNEVLASPGANKSSVDIPDFIKAKAVTIANYENAKAKGGIGNIGPDDRLKILANTFGFYSNGATDGNYDFYFFSDPSCPSCATAIKSIGEGTKYRFKLIPLGLMGPASGEFSTVSLCENKPFNFYRDQPITSKGSQTDSKRLTDCAYQVIVNDAAFRVMNFNQVPTLVHAKTGQVFSGPVEDSDLLSLWVKRK